MDTTAHIWGNDFQRIVGVRNNPPPGAAAAATPRGIPTICSHCPWNKLYYIWARACIYRSEKKLLYKRQPSRQSQNRLKLLYIYNIYGNNLQHARPVQPKTLCNYNSARVVLAGVASVTSFLILTPQSLKQRLCKCKSFNETLVFPIPRYIVRPLALRPSPTAPGPGRGGAPNSTSPITLIISRRPILRACLYRRFSWIIYLI